MIVLLNDPLNVLSVGKSFMLISVTMEMKNCCNWCRFLILLVES